MSTPWADPAWQATTLDWARARLAEAGWRIDGEITQPHLRPWSTVFRIPTDHGPAWCKASGPGTGYEARLLTVFARRGIRGALLPLAADPDRRLLLLPDGGTTLRGTRPDGTGDHDLLAWARILDEYARLQRSTEPLADELIAAGVPDLRPGRLVAALEPLIADDAIWARADADDRPAADAARRRLPGLLPEIAAMAEVLESSGVAAAIQHDDLHGGNILVGPEGDRIFDWGDGAVMHPFGTMTATMNSIEYHAGFDQDGPELRRLRAGYLEHWTDVAPIAELEAATRRAMVLGAISRAASWERAFTGLELADVAEHAESTAAWLVEFVERLDRARAEGLV